jgi:hypothetical protein
LLRLWPEIEGRKEQMKIAFFIAAFFSLTRAFSAPFSSLQTFEGLKKGK